MAINVSSIPDSENRRLAATTFDRNVVVVAGAGTGKTTLLVNRFLHTLMREPHPLSITQIVALTFTNKAAGEMKARIRQRLAELAGPDPSLSKEESSGVATVADLQEHYQLSEEEISKRAGAALENFEKAQIGTVHSFAGHLLRLYPLEGRVDPLFQEDDGSQFDNFFDQEWKVWVDGELGPDGGDHVRWRKILEGLELTDIRQVALALCNEMVPLHAMGEQIQRPWLPEILHNWLSNQQAQAVALRTQYERPKKRKIEAGLALSQEVFEVLLEGRLDELHAVKIHGKDSLNGQYGKPPLGWTESDFREARRIIALAKNLASIDHGVIQELFKLLEPFVRKVREGFIDEGLVTFDGLLARANRLLRDHQLVRELLKKEYKAILVDEFQDTDPIQYEMILYLAERLGNYSPGWSEVKLAPGKLFIVGDPKQSIYAFRRADLEAYELVVQKVKDSGGEVFDLHTNFRSHPKVLEVVNTIFQKVFEPIPRVQPANVHLQSPPDRVGEVTRPGVELYAVRNSDQTKKGLDSESATRLEAEGLACWIKNDLLRNAVLMDPSGQRRPLQAGDVGFLLRKLTQAQVYLDALRRYDIPYVIDGDKHYYRRQEVIDFINVLRVIENHSDITALIGVSRSPLGALTDQEIYELHGHEAFDIRDPSLLQNWTNPKKGVIERFYATLVELGQVAFILPIPAFIDQVFSRLPVLELAYASRHQGHALANLLKFRELANRIADRPHLSLTEFIDQLMDRLKELPPESEGGGAEESPEAIRVLTVHKAKGLEFPVVILPGLHQGSNMNNRDALVSHDWASGSMGLSVGDRRTLGAAVIGEKNRIKEEAEQRRLLYVAMTRAKERLILSCGIPDRVTRGSFLAFLQEVANTQIGSSENGEIQMGTYSLPQTIEFPSDPIPTTKRNEGISTLKDHSGLESMMHHWEGRERQWALACFQKEFLTPTALLETPTVEDESLHSGVRTSSQGSDIGTLIHKILEVWDFKNDLSQMDGILKKIFRTDLFQEVKFSHQDLPGDLFGILESFVNSEPYRKLQMASIIGREIPFVVPWDCSDHLNRDIKNPTGVMEGVIDLLYRLNGRLWVADYKTDYVEEPWRTHLPKKYEWQANIYREAVAQSLGITPVECEIVLVRHGLSIRL